MTMHVPMMRQDDQALRLLAQMYARWFMRASSQQLWEICEQVRNVLYTAGDQQDAYEQLISLVETAPETSRKAYERARDLVAHVIQAGGSADALIVGETDGYRHLCLACSQDEHNFQRVHFFNMRERRPLLIPEVGGERRSAYARCQLCLQPIHPNAFVLFVLVGTEKHLRACHCGKCNRAGVAYLLNIYDCNRETQRVLLPALHNVVAPSRQKCVGLAVELCWERGWYMFNKDSVLPF